LGDVSPERVNAVFAAYDLFILPTLGENFGHVILEALTAGTPVLTSDQTQWKADNLGGLNILTLKDSSLWSAQITNWAKMGDESLLLRREAAKKIALKILKDKNVLQQNRNLFRKLLTS
jgi:glycosyltransferase involved in cell wall biosynthesis